MKKERSKKYSDDTCEEEKHNISNGLLYDEFKDIEIN
eukprot:CAMPEP_0116893910 /NCGR_PEP_ID=MMETSP0467-20121206/3800_1 /TAXON_ID=283647 /ORGANISM="Mesodinium pulex, Strain SPMC105" /LENGTH=36 /DNA_ID= /DNA_START= /DNA_END= /DNA_ORIENTATION=